MKLCFLSIILIPNFRKSAIQKGDLMTRTIQLRKRGFLTLPMELRKRYQLEEGDPVTLVDLDEGIFLCPRPSVLPKLAAQIEEIRRKNDVSLAELVEGVVAIRKQGE